MDFLDLRTLVVSHLATGLICSLVITSLWWQHRHRYAGLSLMLAAFALQLGGTLLLALRGQVPDWVSMVVGNTGLLGAVWLILIGLERFFGQAGRHWHNVALLAIFVSVQTCFCLGQPSLLARQLNLSIGMFLFCVQCLWLLWRGVPQQWRSLTRGLALIFGGFCLVNLARIPILLVNPPATNDYFRNSLVEALVFIVFQLLVLLLAFGSTLLVTGRIRAELQAREEKAISDATERRRAEERLAAALNYSQTILEASPAGIALHELVVDAEGRAMDYRIMDVNPAFERQTGLSAASAKSQLASQLYGTAPPFLEIYAQTVRTGESQTFEVYFPPLQRHFDISVWRPQPGWFATAFMDITERKRAEEQLRHLHAELRQHADELDQRVRERTAALELANQELEGFSYSVSHDLRAPLRAIDGFANNLLADQRERLDEEGRRLLDIVCREAKRMGQLIDDLLAFSRMSRQAMRSETIEMGALAQEIFAECLRHAPNRQICFKLRPLPTAQGDPALLRQVLINLLGNAIKYTRPRPVATIEVGGRVEDAETVYYVKDNGVGFDPKYAHKLFGVFQRLHTEDEFEGTGVGLAIVQRVIRRHGGRVWAESQVDGGAVFHFTLPNKDSSPCS